MQTSNSVDGKPCKGFDAQLRCRDYLGRCADCRDYLARCADAWLAAGVSGHALTAGYMGHALAAGVSGHAQAAGVSGAALSTGLQGTATALGDCKFIVLGDWRRQLGGVLKLVDLRVGRVGIDIERGVRYRLDNWQFVAVTDETGKCW